jgi:hypothetical protein
MSRKLQKIEIPKGKSSQWIKKVTERYLFEELYCCRGVAERHKKVAKQQQKKQIRAIGKRYLKEWD